MDPLDCSKSPSPTGSYFGTSPDTGQGEERVAHCKPTLNALPTSESHSSLTSASHMTMFHAKEAQRYNSTPKHKNQRHSSMVLMTFSGTISKP